MEVAFAGSYSCFAIPGIAEVVAGNGGLPKVQITTREAAGEIYLHGAHVTSWKPAGQEEVFFSARGRDGKMDMPFVEACRCASPGSEASRAIPRRRRTGSYARRPARLSRSRKLAVRSP